MSDEPLSFEEDRGGGENASTVRCARCGKWIVATATSARNVVSTFGAKRKTTHTLPKATQWHSLHQSGFWQSRSS